ncbi:MAG: flagellar protein FliT [Methylobacter sp.]
MPSKAKECSFDLYPELAALNGQVHEYVADELWEQLPEVLEQRQRCLEVLFANTAEPEHESLRGLADSIIEQDAVLIEKIQAQQEILGKEIRTFDKGRQAARAYDAI